MDHNSESILPSPVFPQFDIKSPMSYISSKRQREHEEFPVYNEDFAREKKVRVYGVS